MSTLPSPSTTTQQGLGPSAAEDHAAPRGSNAFKEAVAPEPLVPNVVVLNTSTAREFSPTHGPRHGTPVWREAMDWHRIGWHIARCMYINGQISVGGKGACSILRNLPCQRCQRGGRGCWIRDPEKETLVKLDKCGECLRLGGSPVSLTRCDQSPPHAVVVRIRARDN